jgi:hypothetical protein
MVLRCVADDVCTDGQADPNPVKAIQGKYDRVHEDGPGSKDQPQYPYEPGKVETRKGRGYPDRSDEPPDQEAQPGAEEQQGGEKATHFILLFSLQYD